MNDCIVISLCSGERLQIFYLVMILDEYVSLLNYMTLRGSESATGNLLGVLSLKVGMRMISLYCNNRTEWMER